jgi:hypothetical protein
MAAWQFILAEDDTSGFVKVLPVVILFSLWGLGALSKLAKRKTQNTQRPIPPAPAGNAVPQPAVVRLPFGRVVGAAPRKLALPPRPSPPGSVAIARPAARPGTVSAKRARAAVTQQQADLLRRMPAGRREPALSQPQPVLTEVTPAPKDPPVPGRNLPMVDVRALTKRMQPVLLRYQYILTEVLRPPVALRGEEDDF